jgi:hypothetical protein
MKKKSVNFIIIFALLFSAFSTTTPVQAKASDIANGEIQSTIRQDVKNALDQPAIQTAPQPKQNADGELPALAKTPMPMRAPELKDYRSLGLGNGIYDDTEADIDWAGGWTSVSNNNALGGSYHSSTTIGDTATVEFTGTQFSLYFIKAPNRGTAQVKIDGKIVATFSMAAGTVSYSQRWDTPIQQDEGPHTVVVTHISGGEIVFDGFGIASPDLGTPLSPGYYEDNANLFEFSGIWVDFPATPASGENLHYSATIDSGVSFNFSGNQLRIIYTGYLNRGIMQVYVDGILIGSINQYASEVSWRQSWTSPLLESSDSHYVELRHASGAVIDIDAIEVLDVTPPDSIGPGTYQETDGNLSFAGQWLSAEAVAASGGAVSYSLDIGNTISVSFTGNQVSLLYTGYPNRGVMGVFIDGTLVDEVNQYAASTEYQKRWTSPLLDDTGPHTLQFKHMTGAVAELDALIIANNSAVGVGKYESNSQFLNYVGQWQSASPVPGASASEVTYSAVAGNRASMRFSGNQIKLYYTGYPNRGIMNIYINNALVDSLNQYSAEAAYQEIWESSVLSNTGPHTIEVVHSSGQFVDIDAIEVIENDPLVPGTYEDSDTKLSFTGAWTQIDAAAASGGTLSYSLAPGNSVSLRFAGQQVSLVYTGYPNRGIMGVYIDGELAGLVDEYSENTAWQSQWDSPELSSVGPHALEFKHESGAVVELDAVIIAATPVPTITPEPTESPIFNPPDGKEMYRASFAPNQAGDAPSSTSANYDSYGSSISDNGRYTVFSSLATNLIYENDPCMSDGQEDVYLHDRQTRTNQCLSTLYGAAVDDESTDASIDASGEYVVFTSSASSFSSGGAPVNVKQVYVWHRTSNSINLVSSPDGEEGYANGDCYDPYITPGGQYVVFSSDATNLVADDSNGQTDVFLRDMGDIGGDGVYSGANQHTIMISRTLQGGPLSAGNIGSTGSYVSDDGQKIAFTSDSPDLTGDVSGSIKQVFLFDRETGLNTEVSAVSDGQGGKILGDGDSRVYGISRDGRFTMFYSVATNLVPGGDGTEDAYIYDAELDVVTIMSLPEGQAIDPFPEIVDGKILFETSKALMAADTNNQKDIYMRVSDGSMQLVSLPVGASNPGDYASHSPALSRDGRFVVFQSSVNDLDPVDNPPWDGEPILDNIYIRAVDDTVLVTDNTAPAAVTDLDASPGTEDGEADLSWTSSGDDDLTGAASEYDIRYSLSPITTEEEWDVATHVADEIVPDEESGTTESMTVSGLEHGTVYYFAIKVGDEVPNWSDLSNSSSTMTPGVADAGEGVYEDDGGEIVYEGTWVSFSIGGASGNNVHYSTTQGSSATLHFAGNQVSLLYTGFSNRGVADIYVDGQLIGSVNQFSADVAFQERWTSPVLGSSGSSHILEIRHVSGAVIDIDALEVIDVPDAAPLEPGVYQENDPNLSYSGDWVDLSSALASGGATRYSTTIGNDINTDFYGDRIKITYTGYPNRGVMGVYVDGLKIGEINQYAAAVAWQQEWLSPILLTSDLHTLTLKHESGAVAELDALTIIAVPPVGVGTYEDNNENLIYEGSWSGAAASGASGESVRYSTKVGSKIALRFTGNQFRIVYTALSNRGVVGVYLDGQKIDTINEYADEVNWQKNWSSPLLPSSGPHLLEIVHESGAVVDLDAIEILERVSSGVGTYQEDNELLEYVGEWHSIDQEQTSGGSVRYSVGQGNLVSFLFTGTKISIVYTGMNNRGVIGVYIDNELVANVDQYTEEISFQQMWTSSTLADSGPHSLEIRHESGAVVDLDALVIE